MAKDGNINILPMLHIGLSALQDVKQTLVCADSLVAYLIACRTFSMCEQADI